MQLKARMMNRYLGTDLKPILLLLGALVFYSSVNETSWAAVIVCPNQGNCDGTAEDDIIWGTTDEAEIRGFLPFKAP